MILIVSINLKQSQVQLMSSRNIKPATTLTEISTDFMLTEAAFIQANRNMTQILGTEINTIHGTVEELIQIRSKKIRNLRINAGVEIVKKEEDQQS